MNTNYGFDMLSAAHWEYLGTLQARRSEIKPDFYISLISGLFIALVGLYIIVRPKTRHIKIAKPILPKPTQKSAEKTSTQPIEKTENTPAVSPNSGASLGPRPMSPLGSRPPTVRPLTVQNQTIPAPKPMTTAPTIQNSNSPELERALEASEYIIKKCNKIGKIQNPLVAIAYNQSIFIISTKTSPDDMLDAIQTLVTIFDDTLGETANDISVRGFIISPSEPVKRQDELIVTFDSNADFIKYVNEHKNEKPKDYDAELFDAFSTYISTVTGYIGKV